jgi:outer membrane protein OmpA-like peptidoglycan-associated protein
MAEEEVAGHSEGGGGAGHGGHKSGHGGGPGGGGHGEEHEGAPEWLISFADNVTLMMGFFVIMLAFFMKDANVRGGVRAGEGDSEGNGALLEAAPDMLDWALAVRAAFNNPVDADSLNPRDQSLVQRLRARSGVGPATDPGPKGRHEATHTLRPSDYFGLGGLVPFEASVGELSAAAQDTIRDIAVHLTGFRSVIEVRGHVSLAEAHQLPNNGMALSYQRAAAVAEALAAAGVEWVRLRLIACGAGDPVVVPAYDDAGQRSNQRVEIVVTDRAALTDARTVPAGEEAAPEEPESQP